MTHTYEDNAGSLNFYIGCTHGCTYCVLSYQWLLKRSSCPLCRTYTPHPHLERLNKPPPKTNGGQFVFFPSCSDWAMIPQDVRIKAYTYMRAYSQTNFLLQTKNPHNAFAWQTGGLLTWPPNAILGITLETDRSTRAFSNAPEPIERYEVFRSIQHPRKMITVEPVADFNMDCMLDWILNIKPWRVYVGYNSRPKEAPIDEPPLAKTVKLVLYLRNAGIDIRTKLMREKVNP